MSGVTSAHWSAGQGLTELANSSAHRICAAGGVRPAARIAPGTHRAARPGLSAIWAEGFNLTGPYADACKPVFRRAESRR